MTDSKIITTYQQQIEHHATTLAQVMQGERTGTRDGDGTWYGSDAYHAALTDEVDRIVELRDRLREVEAIANAREPF